MSDALGLDFQAVVSHHVWLGAEPESSGESPCSSSKHTFLNKRLIEVETKKEVFCFYL